LFVAVALSLLLFPYIGLEDLRFEAILWEEMFRRPQEILVAAVEILGGLVVVSMVGSAVTIALSGGYRLVGALAVWSVLLGRAVERESFFFRWRYSPGTWLRDFVLAHPSLRAVLEAPLLGQLVVGLLAAVCIGGILSQMVKSQERIAAFKRRQVLRDLDVEFKSLAVGTVSLLLCLGASLVSVWALGGPRKVGIPAAASEGLSRPNLFLFALPPAPLGAAGGSEGMFMQALSRKLGQPARASGPLRGVSSEALPRWFSFFSGELPSNIGLWHDFPTRVSGAALPAMLPGVASQYGYVTAAIVPDEAYFVQNVPFGFMYQSVEPLTIKNLLDGFLASNVRVFASVIRLPRVCALFSRWCLVTGQSDWEFRRQMTESVLTEAVRESKSAFLFLRGEAQRDRSFQAFSTGLLSRLKRAGWLKQAVVVFVQESAESQRDGFFALWDLRGRTAFGASPTGRIEAREFDFAPTLSDLIDVSFPPGFVDGGDLFAPSAGATGLFPRGCVLWNGWRRAGANELKVETDTGDGGRLVALASSNTAAYSHQQVHFSCGDAMLMASWNAAESEWKFFRRESGVWRAVARDAVHFASEFSALMRRRGFLIVPVSDGKASLIRGEAP
jgi:hypothetical protein